MSRTAFVTLGLLAAGAAFAGAAPPPAGTTETPAGAPTGAIPPGASAATASTADATGAPTTPPGATAPSEPSPAREIRSVFEYIETLTVESFGNSIEVRSNVVVEVTTTKEGTVVELRPVAGRKPTKPEDPPPGRLVLTIGDEEPSEHDVEAVRVSLERAPTARGSLTVEGVGGKLAREAVGVLSQAPTRTVLASDAVASYEIELQSAGLPAVVRAEQRNAKLWVDWTLTGAGTFEVGKKGWELPVKFVLPEQELGSRGAKLSAEASMRYSSVRPGPERETTLVTTIVIPGAEGEGTELVYTRKGELRPLALELGVELFAPDEAAARKLFGGRAGDWARTATLATLGVQRLAGVRESGVAMWLCQVSIDSAAGKATPGISDPEAARALVGLSRLAPDISPPSWLEAEMRVRGAKVRLEVCESFMAFTAEADGSSDTASSDVPDLLASLRWDWRGRLRLGAEFATFLARLNTTDPVEDWSMVSIMGRAEFATAKWNAGVSVGPALVQYEADSQLRRVTGDSLPAYALAVDGEVMTTRTIGLSLRADYVTKDGLRIVRARPAVRWYMDPNVALQAQLTYLALRDGDAEGGGLSADGTGFGMGLFVKY